MAQGQSGNLDGLTITQAIRGDIGCGQVEFYIPDLRYKFYCYLSQISIPQVMKMVLNLTCYFSNKSFWDFRMLIARNCDKERYISQIGYLEFENAAHSYRPFPFFPSFVAPR